MHPDAPRLFALDEALRAEADALLAASGFGAILTEAGYYAVGSYVMHTMTRRDLDFHCECEPDWRVYWEVATRLSETGWCARLSCIDVYREGWEEYGYYLGVRAADPACPERGRLGDPTTWNLDLWTARPEEFSLRPQREAWSAALTDEARSYILAIKEAVRDGLAVHPPYRKSVFSIHIYEAVLERGIRTLDEFRAWWEATYAPAA